MGWKGSPCCTVSVVVVVGGGGLIKSHSPPILVRYHWEPPPHPKDLTGSEEWLPRSTPILSMALTMHTRSWSRGSRAIHTVNHTYSLLLNPCSVPSFILYDLAAACDTLSPPRNAYCYLMSRWSYILFPSTSLAFSSQARWPFAPHFLNLWIWILFSFSW